MTLTQSEVEHVARLARLSLTPDEVEQMREQLSAILDYVAMLQEVDVADVPPTAQVSGLGSVMRPDEVLPSLTPQQVLANAPEQRDGMFRVKAVFDE